MRIRSIRPEFWRSDDVSALSWDTRLVFIGLWSYVDDNGVGVDKLAAIVADLFADDLAEEPVETIAKVSRALDDLSSRGLVTRYEVDGKRFVHVSGFGTHQRVDKPSKPRYPLPPEPSDNSDPLTSGYGDSREDSGSTPGVVAEGSPPGEGEKGRRGEGEKGTSLPSGESAPADAKPKRGTRLPADWMPTPEDQERMAEECPGVRLISETNKFRDYWAGVPGARGVKLDWNGTWRNWIRKAAEDLARRRPAASTAPASTTSTPAGPSRHDQKVQDIFDRGARLADAADLAHQEALA
ncbi:hypothetical protein [Nocardia asteroides]|uniref:hypothetical protein n=1 Tax=Nocardia asteroides TaxID=1824 RepID=UPI0033C7FF0A